MKVHLSAMYITSVPWKAKRDTQADDGQSIVILGSISKSIFLTCFYVFLRQLSFGIVSYASSKE